MQTSPLLVLVITVGVAVAGNNKYTKFYQTLDEDLKIPFLQYQLADALLSDNEMSKIKISPIDKNIKSPEGLGLPKDVFQKIEDLDPPSGFADNLYQLVKEKFELNRFQIREIAVGRQICFEGRKQCYDIGDTGSNCC